MRDAANGSVIYKTSFSSLFQEWLETDEAKAVTKEEAKALLARPVAEFYDNKKEKIEYGYKF